MGECVAGRDDFGLFFAGEFGRWIGSEEAGVEAAAAVLGEPEERFIG